MRLTNREIGDLYEENSRYLIRWLKYKGCNSQAVREEIVHDAFVKLMEHASELRDKSAVRSWLFTTTERIYLNHVLKASSRYETEIPQTQEGEDVEFASPDIPPTYLEDECVGNKLKQFYVTDRERAFVISLQLDNIPIKEISRLVNRTEQATRQFIYESKKKLKPLLEECWELV